MASGSMYASYQPSVASELSRPSPLTIAASYVLIGGQVTVTADIGVDLATAGSGRVVKFFVAQADLHGHLNMVVATLPDEAFGLTAPGQTVSVQRTFAMDPAWTQPELAIIVLVQNTTTREIYQSAAAVPAYAGSIVIDCEPDGVEADWTITGPDLDRSGEGDLGLEVFVAGEYTLTWAEVPYWDAPVATQSRTLDPDGTITFTGTYANGPFAAQTAAPLGDVAASAAVSLVDIDNDGDLDIHLTSNGAGDLLLRNDGGALFTELASSPLASAGAVRSAAWADINGDGNLDVYLTRPYQMDRIYLGDGSGGFSEPTVYDYPDAGPGAGAVWVDFDNDGLLDLSQVNQGTANVLLDFRGERAPGLLLFNQVGGTFSHTGNGSCVVWGDGDLDGRPDPFLVNQFNANVLYQNTTLGFQDLTSGQGMGDTGNGKGAAWGDYDNDGDLDLYVANDGQADRLYKCTGPFMYTQVPGANLGDPGRGRGVLWADFDNDTHLDLYLARCDQPDLFLLGDGQGGFTRVPVGPAEATSGSNAVACGDLDGDGRLDVVITREGAPNVLFANNLNSNNHWARLHLTGSGTNTGAIGARVVLTAGGVSQTRYLSPGSAYLASQAVDPHFGLGGATLVDQIDIHWPSGLHQVVGPQLVDRVIAITEGSDPASAVVDAAVPRATTLGEAYPNPFNPGTTIAFALARPAAVRLAVYTIDGRHVRTLKEGNCAAGPHQVVWRGTDSADRPVASGTYLYRLHTDDGTDRTGRMVLLK